MKITGRLILFILVFCSVKYVAAQDRTTGTIRVRKPADLMPLIAGKNEGKITPGELCSKDGIYVTAQGVKIIAFEITYFSSKEITQTIDGNRITDKICLDIQRMKSGELIHIYDILAMDAAGRKFTLLPMRFTADVPEIKNENIFVSGLYQEKLEYIPINKNYIKIGQMSGRNSGPAWSIKSAGEPIVLNQFYENIYRNEGVYHGEYFIIGSDSIFINFDEQYSICDYRGKITSGRLELKVVGHDGQVYDDRVRYIVLPFSRK